MVEAGPKPKRLTLAKFDWEISFLAASITIEKRLGVSRAEAERRLRHACAEEHIRSYKERYRNLLDAPVHELQTRIAPDEWRARAVDFDRRDADGFATEVSINEGDLHYWFKSQPLPKAAKPRDAEIRKLLEAGQRPPDNVSWKEFCQKVRGAADGWTKTGGELREARGFSEKQIQRAVKQMTGTSSTS